MAKSTAALAERMQPLEGRVYGGNSVTLTPAQAMERVSLRSEEKAVAALGKAIGLSLPRKPGTSVTKGDVTALWIGPDEWLVLGTVGSGLEAKLNKVKTGLYSVVSVDNRNTGLVVSGANAVNAINGGCPRDLSLKAFPVGGCGRTIIGKAEVVLWRTGEDTFHVECWRSFSDYVWKYLADCARSA